MGINLLILVVVNGKLNSMNKVGYSKNFTLANFKANADRSAISALTDNPSSSANCISNFVFLSESDLMINIVILKIGDFYLLKRSSKNSITAKVLST